MWSEGVFIPFQNRVVNLPAGIYASSTHHSPEIGQTRFWGYSSGIYPSSTANTKGKLSVSSYCNMSRPMNCFILYCKENRKRIQLQHPDLSNSVITSILGAQWRAMDESQKYSYKKLATEHRKVKICSNYVY